MDNGAEKEYDLPMIQVDEFLDWYNYRADGSGPAVYMINKTYNIGPFLSRKDYIPFDKILNFEVSEYSFRD
ncbi:hypothetical protein OXPF_05820 [Oxobacter pfennigii]|uniref:Uncharacterized protein n=1 Tax=Oxobacter pfennigii TaxID=36849 RepID=A0A0P9AKB6_9CLOT|nr:galactose oxidase [Oxobacter pfennigii]KPU45793.1 hypothetical protein OXPF_05820 [Oxobacter pfennigii]